jgi:hypothetical protein
MARYTDQLTKLPKRAILFDNQQEAQDACGSGTGVWGVAIYSSREGGWYVMDRKADRLYLADPALMPKRPTR